MNLQSLLECLPQYNMNKKENPLISSIEMDSREVSKGSLFICIKGFTVDGHQFIEDAIRQGAAAIVAEREIKADVPVVVVNDTQRAMAILADYFYDHPTQRFHLIGVTGTNGKTTVTHILEKIFQEYGQKTGIVGTIHTKIGNEVFDVKNTTPESLVLQKTFKKMVDEGVNSAFMEVSSHALHLGRVRGCEFNVAVFTNLSQDHLDYHKTMEEYRKAKGLLFAQLGNHYDPLRPKFAILNNDDPSSEEYKRMTAAHVITYGIDQKADITAKNIITKSDGTSFTIVTKEKSIGINMKLVGKFSIYNVLASLAASLASNVPIETAKAAIERLNGVPGRFELVTVGQDFSVIVDYAHTPDSLENVLTTIQQFATGRIFVVVGCGGDRDRKKRPIMASIAEKYADLAIFTSDNPRSEDPLKIIRDMENGVKGQSYKTIIDRKVAIEYAIETARTNDVILIAGKGHETYQQIGSETFEFDDRKVAAKALKERVK